MLIHSYNSEFFSHAYIYYILEVQDGGANLMRTQLFNRESNVLVIVTVNMISLIGYTQVDR